MFTELQTNIENIAKATADRISKALRDHRCMREYKLVTEGETIKIPTKVAEIGRSAIATFGKPIVVEREYTSHSDEHSEPFAYAIATEICRRASGNYVNTQPLIIFGEMPKPMGGMGFSSVTAESIDVCVRVVVWYDWDELRANIQADVIVAIAAI